MEHDHSEPITMNTTTKRRWRMIRFMHPYADETAVITRHVHPHGHDRGSIHRPTGMITRRLHSPPRNNG